jgi:protein SCO1/2
MGMNWRLASRLSVITLAILVVLLVAILQHNTNASSPTIQQSASAQNDTAANTASTQGTDLGGKPAPNFRLTDQAGKQISLTQFKGEPVILTFLYTNCPDECPLTAEKLHTTLQSMGSSAQHVAVVAVSTDPARDTVAAALKFSKAHNMQDSWHYLVGTRSELVPVWTSYGIYAQPNQQQVNHSLGLFLIDTQGNERLFLDSNFTPNQLADNIKTLL